MANEEQLKILRKGFSEWNLWCMHHGEQPVDLRYADLRSADLRGAVLIRVNLQEALPPISPCWRSNQRPAPPPPQLRPW